MSPAVRVLLLYVYIYIYLYIYNFFLDTEISVYNLELFIYFTLSSIHLLVHTCIIRYIFLHLVVLIIITHFFFYLGFPYGCCRFTQ